MTKLLNRSLKVFVGYTLIVLLCSVPVYFWVVEAIWVEEIDEQNLRIEERVIAQLRKKTESTGLNDLIRNLNNLHFGVSITRKKKNTQKEVIFFDEVKSLSGDGENDRFRGRISYFKLNGEQFQIITETNVEEADETILSITLVTLIFVLFLVIGFILLNQRLSKKIWSPFMKTMYNLKQFDLHENKPLQVEPTDIEEFSVMNNSLIQLSEQNLKAFNQQKSFIENASHELQTPLAVLKSKIDILVQDDNLSEQQRKKIADIEVPLSRVSRINKNLLFLAKIENNQFSEEESLSLNDLLNQTLLLFHDYIDLKQIVIDLKEEQVEWISNYFLMETVLTNLLSNAIKHTSANGKISIELNSNKLSIANTGENELNKESLFNRFTVHSSDTTNSGLGLAMINEICKRYNWEFVYHFKNRSHYFEIYFKIQNAFKVEG